MVATQTNGQKGTSLKASTSNGTHGDAVVFAKMDSLQNQLNQVMLMLQNPQVSLPNGHIVTVTTLGSVRVKPNLVLHNVFYIPSFAYNLLSGNNKRIAHGILSDGLYIIKPNTASAPTPTEFSQSFPTTILSHSSNLHLWHARLGHPSTHVIKQMKNLPHFTTDVSKLHCTICPIAKQTALPFPSSSSYANALFELIHADTWGPYKHLTLNNYKYFLTLVDDYSRTTWTFLIPTKNHVTSTLKNFYSYVTTQFHTAIKVLRSDNGTEFTNNSLTTFLQNKGITHKTPTKWQS
ncbi:putative RNA-directed DNA polymerase [Tanacetum coccineum]|uniref:RNA-directed DNA polymerase n=1 Tax=Tanacetum coccineum TaxID=301880 RepID=A0ABQ5E2N3_9ASTR